MDHEDMRIDRNAGAKCAFFVIGIAINLLGAQLPGILGVPLFLDNIGTFFTVAFIGTVPGMAVGYLGNLAYSFQQPEWLYWGLFGVIMAWLAGRKTEKGEFSTLPQMWKIIPAIVFFTGFLGEMFSWVLNGFDFSSGATGELAMQLAFYLPLPYPVLRIVACCVIEIIDKLVVLTAAFCCIKAASRCIGSLHIAPYAPKLSPLRRRMVTLITVTASVTGLAVFMLACHTHYYTLLAVRDVSDPMQILRESLTFGGGLFSAMLGAEICLVMLSITYIDWSLVKPVRQMTLAMRNFVGDSGGKYEDANIVTHLQIETEDELATLQDAMATTATDVVDSLTALRSKMDEINALHTNIINLMADIIESRDVTTGAHVKRTSAYSAIIARQLRKDGWYRDEITDRFISDLQIASPLHDVGKICVSDTILNKPGRLTKEEFDIMKTHTTHGREIVRKAMMNLGNIKYLDMAMDLAAYHHEWWNGKGYPEGLKEEKIPLSARIMALADVYDALTTSRPYKRAFTPEEALRIIAKEERGTHFEPAVVDAFVHAHDKIEEVRKQT